VRLRVPSGKITNELPARSAWAGALNRRPALFRIAALQRHESSASKCRHQDRQLAEFAL
jgi:hypothetical protein